MSQTKQYAMGNAIYRKGHMAGIVGLDGRGREHDFRPTRVGVSVNTQGVTGSEWGKRMETRGEPSGAYTDSPATGQEGFRGMS
jgi:hypothetical protein